MSEIRSLNGQDHYGYAVCGLGPAGCGFLLHAIREEAIGRMVERGLVLIDRSPTPGSGKVGRYRLTGNSLSRAFLDCIDDPKLAWLFQDLTESAPSVMQLRDREDAAPPLDIVGDFLDVMARRTLSYLSREYGVPVLLQTSIETIRRRIDGRFTLDLHGLRGGIRKSLHVDNVLCSLGGRQDIDVIRRCALRPGLRLGDHAAHIIPSDQFLTLSNDAIRDVIPMAPSRTGEVAVVGGSHSAMSTIDRLTDALGPVGLRRIVMLHRDPLRLYYASADEARRDGYAFDDARDICPMSGRVNRFGGLRYRSFDVGKSIIETGRTPDQSVEVVSVRLGQYDWESVRQHLTRSRAVIACLGYQANLPPVIDAWNQELDLMNGARGLDVDDRGRALEADGQAIPGLFACGIGSRLLKRSEAIGGEPSFRGSADGVWLYQNHGGSVILEALRTTFSKAADRPGRAEWSANHARAVNAS